MKLTLFQAGGRSNPHAPLMGDYFTAKPWKMIC